MYNSKTSSLHNAFLSIACAAFFLVASTTGTAWTQDCQTALGSSSGYTALASGDTATKEKEIDEWSGDVIKFRTTRPGVLVVEAVGTGAQNALYTAASSGSHPLVDSSRLGTGLRELQAVIRAGDHCIQVAPPTGATGDYRVDAYFVDVCHLGDIDDHGDSFLCATSISAGGSKSGEITSTTATDHDMFSLVVSTQADYVIESSGTTDVSVSLFDSEGTLLASDDNGSATSPNFKIIEELDPEAQYYIQVKGANGEYSFSVTQVQ